jgi:hypothetical protein
MICKLGVRASSIRHDPVSIAAVVAQFVGGAVRRRACFVVDAGNGAQVFIDGRDIVVTHVLKEIAVRVIAESSGNAHGRRAIVDRRNLGRRTGWVDVVEIRAGPDDLNKLRQRVLGLIRAYA